MLKVLDLFSGIGGFSLGLERTGGFQTVAFCEIDEHATKVLNKHWPNKPKFKDVTKIAYLQRYGALTDADGDHYLTTGVDVICGGFPCQDISVAGKGEGLEGKRSGLWSEYKRLIQEVKPRYAIIENVANLRGKGLAAILQDLREIGYDAEWHIISAVGVGAVHRRERIWIIAYPMCKGLERSRKTGDVSEICTQEEIGASYSRSITKGGTFSYPNHLRLWKPFASEKEKQKWWSEATSGFRHVFRQILSIEPTIRREHDGFPARLDRNRRQRIKQLGNSIVPQIAQIIGQAILDWEENESK